MTARRHRRAAPIAAIVAIVAIASLAGAGPAAAAPPAASTPVRADVAAGLELADRNCSLCHAVTAGSASRDPRAPAFARVATRYPLDALRAGLAAGGVIGHRGMPQIQLAPQQVDNLIAYLRSLQPRER